MDDVMVAFADDSDGYSGGYGDEAAAEAGEQQQQHQQSSGLPNLSGLVLNRIGNSSAFTPFPAAATAATESPLRIVPVKGSLPRELVGDEATEMDMALATVALALKDAPEKDADILLRVVATAVKVSDIATVHTQMHSDKDGSNTFDSLVASFSMASYGGGGVGVALQFLDSGHAVGIVSRKRGDCVLFDPHARDQTTGRMPMGFGQGGAIAIYSDRVFPLTQYAVSTYGRALPIRYRATFLVPKIGKDKEEEDEEDEEDDGNVKPMSVTLKLNSPRSSAAAAAAVTASEKADPMTATTAGGGGEEEDDGEDSSSSGGTDSKRKRKETPVVAVKMESEESDEKKPKIPPPSAVSTATIAPGTVAAKKKDSVPTVVVKKTPPSTKVAVAATTRQKAAAAASVASTTTKVPVATEKKEKE